MKIGFIGAGTVGTALAMRLNAKGYAVVAVANRSSVLAQALAQAIDGCRAYSDNQGVADTADFVFITTPDDVIATIAAGIQWRLGQSVVHCSGALSSDILGPARKHGAYVGAFHPLQTFASVPQAIANIPGSTFALEAEGPLLDTLKQLATALEGHWIVLQAKDKVIYHAAAVIASNYLVTLVKLATDLWQEFAVPPQQAIQALLPLVKGTISNIETTGIPESLTGPIARGDTRTIEKHLTALQAVAPNLLTTYRELGRQTVPISLAKGRINRQQAEELELLLKQPN